MTVTKRFFLTLLLSVSLISFSQIVHAQKGTMPKSMLEIGAHGGYFFVSGDVAQQPGYAGGIHFRKALDHMFSLRLDGLVGKASGKTISGSRVFDMTWFSGTAFGVISFNSMRFDKNVKRMNYYGLVGVGGNYYTVDFTNEEERNGTIDYEIASHASFGAGIAVRLSARFNIGIEHQLSTVFGKRQDKLDGSYLEGGVRSAFGDILNYTNVRLNVNIGNPSNSTEPLYWVNPMDRVYDDIADVKKRQDELLLDTDNDGIIDALDQEPDTPENVPVDTKGRTLDSDKDGVADYLDKEPYFPPREGEEVNEEGVVINPKSPRGGVTEDKVQEMIDRAFEQRGLSTGGSGGGASVAEWFLPMIHFATDSKKIKFSDYGTLASIGQMMRGNPTVRLVVTGFTDQTGEESYNDALSYARAKEVIDHLVSKQGIGRGRLILHWGGKHEAIVPKTASYMNRRVQFRTAAPDDVEMDPPSGSSSGY